MFIAIPIVAIILSFCWFFTSRQLHERADWEDTDAEVYGRQYALEVRSAVAYSDRATATEILAPVSLDPDIESVSLFAGDGTVIYRSGTPSSWIDQAGRGVVETRLVHSGERSVIVAPVVSLEGPHGTLVIEITSERRLEEEQKLVVTTIVVAIIALVFGALVAWAIARSLARRLRAIGDVATAATNNLDVMVVDDGHDEIGVFADAFNDMLALLRIDRARLEATVTELQTTEDMLAAANLDLEQRVADRTVQLQTEMDRRTEMELELRQAQKLESVGRLAAGIAHEINSPVQFVSDSCTFLDEASQALIELVAERRVLVEQAAGGDISLADLVAKLQAADQVADVDELIQNIPSASRLVLQGLERVTAIVRAMKAFAYADRRAQTPSDLNKAIENTLIVACNEYKYVADVKPIFGAVPPVTCHIGEFNQAVLNIVINAAHAIEDRYRGTAQRGLITIRTWTEAGDACVAITDNGCGIPDDVREKIFDPFFTTKEIGRGSGQGLAIARSVIVDKHRGRLDMFSKVGEGTTFTIRMPIQGTLAAIAA